MAPEGSPFCIATKGMDLAMRDKKVVVGCFKESAGGKNRVTDVWYAARCQIIYLERIKNQIN